MAGRAKAVTKPKSHFRVLDKRRSLMRHGGQDLGFVRIGERSAKSVGDPLPQVGAQQVVGGIHRVELGRIPHKARGTGQSPVLRTVQKGRGN